MPDPDFTAPAERSSWSMCLRLAREHMAPYAGKFALASGCMLVVSATTAAQASLIEPLIDKIFLEQNRSMLYWVTGAVLVVSVLKGACGYVSAYLTRFLGLAVTVDIQKRLFAHLIRHDYAFITDESSGRRVSRFTNDVLALRGAVSGVMTGMLREAFMLAGLLAVMIHQSPLFSLIILTAVPAAVAPVLRMGRKMRRASEATQAELGAYTERLSETLHNISAVQASRAETFEIERCNATLDRLRACYRQTSRIQAMVAPLMESLGGVSVAAVVLAGGLMVADGQTTPGKFTSFLGAVVMAYRPLKSLSGLNGLLHEGLAAARRLFEILDTPPRLRDPATPSALPAPSSDASSDAASDAYVAFENVTFRYPKAERDALNGFTLRVPFGQRVALVGPSGGGKSTVMKLLIRVYDPQHGRVTLGGVDLRDLRLAEARGAVAYVPQRPLLFDATVAENIAYAMQNVSRALVEEAAERAAAAEFIRELPQGYETRVGEYGDTLSGGQRQRLALARALLQNAPVLALDEATSALDNVSERRIGEALIAERGKRTVLLIAHRLSTAMTADRIVVVEGGTVAEEGTHDSLLALGGVYAKLAAQMTRDERS